ncbi:MAG: STAS domain-containing protein [Nocardioidaceae bacterium]
MATREATAGVRHRDGVALIDLVGDVDASAETALTEAWAETTRGMPAAVLLNFTGTGYINSTGIALIVGLLASARAHAIPIRAYGLSPHYREIFEITRLADFVAIDTDEDSAVLGAEGSKDG